MKTITVDGGRMRITYGSESTEALVEVHGPMMATPAVLREVIESLRMVAEDLERRVMSDPALAELAELANWNRSKA
ncbi:MAG: hypothetical protein AAGC55_02045 [Myxococcota bacterium]